jgi:hypothetical protein
MAGFAVVVAFGERRGRVALDAHGREEYFVGRELPAFPVASQALPHALRVFRGLSGDFFIGRLRRDRRRQRQHDGCKGGDSRKNVNLTRSLLHDPARFAVAPLRYSGCC